MTNSSVINASECDSSEAMATKQSKTFRLDSDAFKIVERIAKERNTTQASVIEEALRLYEERRGVLTQIDDKLSQILKQLERIRP